MEVTMTTELILIKLFANTKAYPFIPAGTTPSNWNSTFIG